MTLGYQSLASPRRNRNKAVRFFPSVPYNRLSTVLGKKLVHPTWFLSPIIWYCFSSQILLPGSVNQNQWTRAVLENNHQSFPLDCSESCGADRGAGAALIGLTTGGHHTPPGHTLPVTTSDSELGTWDLGLGAWVLGLGITDLGFVTGFRGQMSRANTIIRASLPLTL